MGIAAGEQLVQSQMNVLEFIAALVTALAWPGTVMITLLVLRKTIERLLLSFKRAKAFDVELEFSEELMKISAAVGATTPVGHESSVPDHVQKILHAAPTAAIPLAWGEIENELQRAVEKAAKTVDDVSLYNSARSLLVLQRLGVIDADTAANVERLRSLRNKVVKGQLSISAIPEPEAWEYAELAGQIVSKLRGMT